MFSWLFPGQFLSLKGSSKPVLQVYSLWLGDSGNKRVKCGKDIKVIEACTSLFYLSDEQHGVSLWPDSD